MTTQCLRFIPGTANRKMVKLNISKTALISCDRQKRCWNGFQSLMGTPFGRNAARTSPALKGGVEESFIEMAILLTGKPLFKAGSFTILLISS